MGRGNEDFNYSCLLHIKEFKKLLSIVTSYICGNCTIREIDEYRKTDRKIDRQTRVSYRGAPLIKIVQYEIKRLKIGFVEVH